MFADLGHFSKKSIKVGIRWTHISLLNNVFTAKFYCLETRVI